MALATSVATKPISGSLADRHAGIERPGAERGAGGDADVEDRGHRRRGELRSAGNAPTMDPVLGRDRRDAAAGGAMTAIAAMPAGGRLRHREPGDAVAGRRQGG